MRKLTYDKKARVRLHKVGSGYIAEYRLPHHTHFLRGVGSTPESAWSSLRSLMHYLSVSNYRWLMERDSIRSDIQVRRQMEAIRRDLDRPDVGLGASDDYHIATSNLPWWRRLFRI